MKFIKAATSLILLILSYNFAAAQQAIITGKIFDINTHRTISHANIYIKDSQIGTISDPTGRFSLTIPKPDSKMMLVIQHVNYDIKQIPLEKIKSKQDYYLQPRIIPLPEVSVDGTG